MLSTSILSYLLPLSLLQSAPLPRPIPSMRISVGLPLHFRSTAANDSLPSLHLSRSTPSTRSSSSLQLVLANADEAGYVDGGFKVPKNKGLSEAVQEQTEDEEEDIEWYYSIASEEELRQELELWEYLSETLARKNGKPSELFKELLMEKRQTRQRGGRSKITPKIEETPLDPSRAEPVPFSGSSDHTELSNIDVLLPPPPPPPYLPIEGCYKYRFIKTGSVTLLSLHTALGTQRRFPIHQIVPFDYPPTESMERHPFEGGP